MISAGTRRRLPIGIQTFREVREEGHYYVDKTGFALQLVTEGKHFFLSRPRRFGKSLLVDTLKELFEGNRELFEGLDAYRQWDWSVRHPVVRLDFSAGNFNEPGGLRASLSDQLGTLERAAATERLSETAPGRLSDLLRALHSRGGQRVVVLVDEYDKPILDALEKPAVASANRDSLRALYGVIKACDAHVRFTLITGVSKFSKVNLFSGLNSLNDITLDPRYSAICGYTEADLDEVFAPELPGLDRAEIRRWYNGYSWRGSERVYNPFDILLLFRKREFRSYWIETGTPGFLPAMLVRRRVSSVSLERMTGDEDLLSKFDVDDIGTEALLFQTGYLTIVGERRRGTSTIYQLNYPNEEVRQSLNRQLLYAMGADRSRQNDRDDELWDLLAAGDLSGMESLFRRYFAGIPSDWHRRNAIARYEGYYASVVYSWFVAAGLDATAEDSGSRGRADVAVRFAGSVYLFEFKVAGAGPPGGALAQMKARGYAEKYLGAGRPVWLVGLEFSQESRNVERFETERVQ